MRPKPVSSLQKTYDDCYLMCSTAVYFEGQNNEEEALKSWRSALETIYYHNAYRLPARYTPNSETERALQESIRQLELQCRERVDLLGALRESRKDSVSGKSPPPGSNATRGWIGEGTVPAVGYTDLSKPPTIAGRSSVSSAATTPPASDPALPPPPPPPPPPRPTAPMRSESQSSAAKSSSRTPSPERRKLMMPSLRNLTLKKPKKKESSSRRKELRPAAASQAAGLAWGSIYRTPSSPDKTANDAALASSRQSLSNDSGFRRDFELPRANSAEEQRLRRTTPHRPAENAEDRREGRKLKTAADKPIKKSPAKRTSSSTPTTPVPKHRGSAEIRQQRASTARSQSASLAPEPKDVPAPCPSPKPLVKPKPVSLRALQPPPPPPPPPPPSSSSPGPSLGAVDSPKSDVKPTSKPQAPRGSATDKHLVPGMSNMSLLPKGPVRRTPVPKRAVTPPSSDPESWGLKSTDADEDDIEDYDPDGAEDDSIMNVLKKLPRGVDVNAARQVLNDIVVRGDEVHWDDIAGLEAAKKALKEAVVYPFLRPDLFSGLREPARGMLLFGPPGTGKTMLARAVATESKSTFFSVSASTLTSKWHGESEKLVRALFGLAKALAPSIIFVDEIDSLLSARSSGTENEASRRSKTEFLIQWSDLQRAAAGREQPGKTGDASRVLVLAATNMPWDIDEAARRRFVRRQYIPLPEHHVREQQLRRLLSHQVHELSDEDIEVLVQVTDGAFPPSLLPPLSLLSLRIKLTIMNHTGFSGSDITALAKDAAMGPLRNLGEALLHTPMDQIRPIHFQDFEASLLSIRPSVSKDGLRAYEDWARQFGERGG
ncbi:hypothetical protein P175DRAFT_0535065 [Aspergillus ochraceoroseus IBT 24754]|nr:uncharacterized protein P175DRAFT_0535065 [Aspergillus ochraceoroseus IBT 24754]PTU18154.1 hypothetical protein P175DRAFT_0535065 [Aspergillus ochraceoroseus IBT 24754]